MAWVISSPALLDVSATPYAPSENWYRQLTDLYQDHINSLEHDPTPLINYLLKNIRSTRLGIYFEVLWCYWFETNQQYQLLHKNLQVFKNKQTIGEYDFIVLNNTTQKTEHWEVAVKFYLKKQINDNTYYWFGPNKTDRWDIKTKKLINTQIELSSKPLAQEQLRSLDIKIDTKKIILKGRLFHPFIQNKRINFEILRINDKISIKHENASWYFLSDFLQKEIFSDYQWCHLNKLNWLSTSSHLNNYSLIAHNTIEIESNPICLAGLMNDVEVVRLFIVPDDW